MCCDSKLRVAYVKCPVVGTRDSLNILHPRHGHLRPALRSPASRVGSAPVMCKCRQPSAPVLTSLWKRDSLVASSSRVYRLVPVPGAMPPGPAFGSRHGRRTAAQKVSHRICCQTTSSTACCESVAQPAPPRGAQFNIAASHTGKDFRERYLSKSAFCRGS